jgi:hypothetical protein
MIFSFVDIGRIVDHHFLNLLFIIKRQIGTSVVDEFPSLIVF